jgi:hypothetical protein
MVRPAASLAAMDARTCFPSGPRQKMPHLRGKGRLDRGRDRSCVRASSAPMSDPSGAMRALPVPASRGASAPPFETCTLLPSVGNDWT